MIIVTGASGFIGTKLVGYLKKKYPKEKLFKLDKNNCDLVTGRGLKKIPKYPRLIFHLAAATDTAKSDQRCNHIGTKNLLEALPGIGPGTHIIFTSSQAVYSGRLDTDKPISEKTKPATNNKYGKTKMEAEKILKDYSKRNKFRLTIVRLPTVWGDNPRSNSFLNFLRSLVQKDSVFSRLNWPGKVALINVEDAAKFITGSASAKPKNISIAVENLTLAEIFEKITQSQGKKYKQIKLPNFIWSFANILRPYLKYFEIILPADIYNYFWRASIVTDSPLWCKVNLKGEKLTS